MTRHPLFAAIVVMLGLLVAEAAAAQTRTLAQSDAVTPSTRQRAPGVPMAPRPAEADGLRDPRDRAGSERYSAPREQRAQREADRDLPMPRGVPSIISD